MHSSNVEETTPLFSGARGPRQETLYGDSDNTIDTHSNLDAENPEEWSAPLKWGIVALVASSSFAVTFNCISVVPAASRIVDDLSGGHGTKSTSVTLVTIWELGEAAGPLLIAPLSEMFGRRPLISICAVLLALATALAALSQTTSQFIASRALSGTAVATNVLGPAIVGDLFAPDQRGTVMSLMMLAPLVGGSAGPALGGIIVQTLGWRPVLWVSVALTSTCALISLVCFPETYRPFLQRRKTKNTHNTPEKDCVGLRTSLTRPTAILFSSGVLAIMSVFGSVMFSHFYIVAVTLPTILQDVYGLSSAATGSTFVANGVGSIIGILLCKTCVDKVYIKLRTANNGVGLPEYRLVMTIIGALTMAPAVILYGWSAEHRLPLPFVIISVVWIRVSLMLAFIPIMAYVVDACGLYSASALTGVIVIRCLAGAFLPLLIVFLIESIGYGWGFTVVGALNMTLALIPALTFRYGRIWRQKCCYTRGE